MENLNLLQKLGQLQSQVTYFQKGAKGYNYKFVSGTEISSKIRPLMDEFGLLLIQEAVDVREEQFKITTKDKQKNDIVKDVRLTHVKFLFTWIDIATGEKLTARFAGQGQDNADKGFGMACTYAERYFLLKFFHVPTDEDDPDRHEKTHTPKPMATKEMVDNLVIEASKYELSQSQSESILLLQNTGATIEKFNQIYKMLPNLKLKSFTAIEPNIPVEPVTTEPPKENNPPTGL